MPFISIAFFVNYIANTLKTWFANPYTPKRAIDLIASGEIDASWMVYATES